MGKTSLNIMHTQAADFAALLPPSGRLLGLDAGEATLGLALCDASRMIASPLETIRRTKFSKDMEALKAHIEKHAACGLVLGYPVNMDGSLGPRTQSIRTLGSQLARQFGLPILLWDERLSTVAVTRVMLDADLSRARRSELVDKMAASYILQSALDALRALV